MLIGIVVLVIMIRFPVTEGRAANLDLFSIYADPFIIYGYLASIPFFVALYQAFKSLGYIRQNKVFSLENARALRNVKYCAITLGVLIVLAAMYIRISFNGNADDDPAGFVAVSIVAAFISIVIAAVAAVLERILQDAAGTKSEKN